MLLAASSPGVQGLNFDQLEDHSFRHAHQKISAKTVHAAEGIQLLRRDSQQVMCLSQSVLNIFEGEL
jgi:hypothetical protein